MRIGIIASGGDGAWASDLLSALELRNGQTVAQVLGAPVEAEALARLPKALGLQMAECIFFGATSELVSQVRVRVRVRVRQRRSERERRRERERDAERERDVGRETQRERERERRRERERETQRERRRERDALTPWTQTPPWPQTTPRHPDHTLRLGTPLRTLCLNTHTPLTKHPEPPT